MSAPAASSLPPINPRLGLMFAAAHHLLPLFRIGTIDDRLARQMAVSAIESYHPETRADYVNVARIIAFSMTALALLGKTASPDMALPDQMRAYGRANALNRSADQSERTMMQRRRHQKANPPSELPSLIDPNPTIPDPESDEAAVDPSAIDPTAIDDAEVQAAVDGIMQEYRSLGITTPIQPAPRPVNPSQPVPFRYDRLRPSATQPSPDQSAAFARPQAMPNNQRRPPNGGMQRSAG
jgi:hypothetical protein